MKLTDVLIQNLFNPTRFYSKALQFYAFKFKDELENAGNFSTLLNGQFLNRQKYLKVVYF